MEQARAEKLCVAFPDCSVLSIEPFGEGVGFLSLMHLCEMKNVAGEVFKVVMKELPAKDHQLYDFTAPVHKKELSFYKEFSNVDSIKDSICEATIVDDALIMNFLENFSMPSYSLGLTDSQVQSALQALAPIHSLHWTAPSTDVKCPEWLLPGDREFLISLYSQFIEPTKLIGEGISETLDLVAQNIDWISTFVCDSIKSQGVVQGDLWNNNVLFNKSKCKIVDWQFSCRMNPLVDVSFLLSSSVSVTLRKEKEDEWVKYYYEQLLRETGASKAEYSLKQCQNEYQEAKIYSLLIMVASFDSFYEPHQNSDDIAQRYISLIQEVKEILPSVCSRIIPAGH